MFLKDLYRYRTTDSKQNREDFLSACLAELMRRDPASCKAVLLGVGFQFHLDLTRYAVRTQVGRMDSKKVMRWCDILVEVGGAADARYIIECKVDARPNRAQIRDYGRMWKTDSVALLAPESKLPPPTDKSWDGVPRGSWQCVWEALDQLPRDRSHGQFRRAVLDLMSHSDFCLGGRSDRSIAQLRQVSAADIALSALREPLRDAVLAIGVVGPRKPVEASEDLAEDISSTQPVWLDSVVTNPFWVRDVSQDGTGLLGLGLNAIVREGVGTLCVDWILEVLPDARLTKKLVKLGRNRPDIEESLGDWWEFQLGDLGGPDTPLHQQIRQAVVASRALLANDLQLPVSKKAIRITDFTTSSSNLAQNLASLSEFNDAMKTWCDYLITQIRSELERRCTGSARAKIVRGTVRLNVGKSELLWFGWERELREAPHWDVHIGFNRKRHQKAVEDALEEWLPPAPVAPILGDPKVLRYRVLLMKLDLRSAASALLETVRSLLDYDNGAVLKALGDGT